jgi:hypothetical protein
LTRPLLPNTSYITIASHFQVRFSKAMYSMRCVKHVTALVFETRDRTTVAMLGAKIIIQLSNNKRSSSLLS